MANLLGLLLVSIFRTFKKLWLIPFYILFIFFNTYQGAISLFVLILGFGLYKYIEKNKSLFEMSNEEMALRDNKTAYPIMLLLQMLCMWGGVIGFIISIVFFIKNIINWNIIV